MFIQVLCGDPKYSLYFLAYEKLSTKRRRAYRVSRERSAPYIPFRSTDLAFRRIMAFCKIDYVFVLNEIVNAGINRN
jgi:hypothetical protein